MKPPDDKMPDEMPKRVMEQMPWLKNPNDLVPTVDPADMKALWQQQKDLAAQPRAPGAVLMINQPWRRYCECRSSTGNAGIGEQGHGIKFSSNSGGWEQYPSVRSF
jgi:hypothetical protein